MEKNYIVELITTYNKTGMLGKISIIKISVEFSTEVWPPPPSVENYFDFWLIVFIILAQNFNDLLLLKMMYAFIFPVRNHQHPPSPP